MSKRVMVSGFYGYNNTGDDLILAGIIASLRRQIPGVEITVLSADPAQTAARYGVTAVYAGRRLDGLGAIAQAIGRSDLFILGGGGLLQDRERRIVPYWLSRVGLARLLGKKVMFYAQGIGPLTTGLGKALVRLVANRVDLITVRDEESKQLLREIGVIRPPVLVTADPALCLERPPAGTGERLLALAGATAGDAPLVGFSLRPWPGIAERTAALAAAADAVVERLGARVVFIPLQAPGDTAVAADVRDAMERREAAFVLAGQPEPMEIAAVLGQMKIVVGMRLHSLILAAGQGVPCVGIIYDPKVANFARRAGLGDYLCDFSRLAAGGLAERVCALWEDYETAVGRLGVAAAAMAEQAEENALLAAGLLAEQRPNKR
ncbi:MAG: polysaccharide pyruvyl transferase CsaB [bacterium]|jgi:polysaccharide pyruvyl transferase CsaB